VAADARRSTLGLTLLCFAFLFAPRLAIGVNLGTVAVAALLVAARRDLVAALRSPDLRFGTVAVLAVIAYQLVVARAYQNDPSYVVRIFVSLPIYLTFGFLFARVLRGRLTDPSDAELTWQVARIALWATVANAIVVLLQAAFPAFKGATESLLMQGISNIDYASHPFSARGFAAAGGAALSVMLAVAVWIAAAMTLVGRLTATQGVAAMATLTLANVFVGRTGLIAAIVAFAAYVVAQLWIGLRRRGRSRRSAVLLLVLLVALPPVVLPYIALDSEALLWAFEWLGTSGDGFGQSSSTEDLRGMLFLPTSATHLLTGVGFFEGSSLQYERTDSGYLKSIFAFGLPLAALIYLSIAALWTRVMARHHQLVLLLAPILLLLFFAEVKEPFLYQNYVGRFVFLVIGVSFAMRVPQAVSQRGAYAPAAWRTLDA